MDSGAGTAWHTLEHSPARYAEHGLRADGPFSAGRWRTVPTGRAASHCFSYKRRLSAVSQLPDTTGICQLV